jgi:hypothetical protein
MILGHIYSPTGLPCGGLVWDPNVVPHRGGWWGTIFVIKYICLLGPNMNTQCRTSVGRVSYRKQCCQLADYLLLMGQVVCFINNEQILTGSDWEAWHSMVACFQKEITMGQICGSGPKNLHCRSST